MGQPSDELIEKIWAMLFERQQSINRQMEESEKKFFQRAEESRLLQEKIEKKFFDRLEEREKQLEEIWKKFYQELIANRIIKEEYEEAKNYFNKKKRRNKPADYNLEMAEHPVYSAIIRLFSERGYKIDSDTLKLYWELVTAITRSPNRLEPPPGS